MFYGFLPDSVFKGRGSVPKHCLYGKAMHNIIFDYAKQFWEAYPENRKFFRTHFSDAHEQSGELISYMDDDILDFLKHFHDKGYLDDTYLVILADHGSHNVILKAFWLPDNSRNVENTHPIFLNLVKKDIPKKNIEFLRSNEQSFMSHHDTYSTLKTIASGKPSNSIYSESYPYISETLPIDRDCTNTTMFLAKCWCYMDPDEAQKKFDEIPLFSFAVNLKADQSPSLYDMFTQT